MSFIEIKSNGRYVGRIHVDTKGKLEITEIKYDPMMNKRKTKLYERNN